MIVSSRVTSKLISELDSGKSSGPDNISPKSLKFASNRLSVLLSFPYENNVYLSKLKANFSPLKFTFWP